MTYNEQKRIMAAIILSGTVKGYHAPLSEQDRATAITEAAELATLLCRAMPEHEPVMRGRGTAS